MSSILGYNTHKFLNSKADWCLQ